MLLLLLAFACTTTDITYSVRCDLDVSRLEPIEAAPGDTVVATVKPATTDFDTAVSVGSERAEISAVDRTACEACDACRETAGCSSCGDCDGCDALCRDECVETVSFVVPELEPGTAGVRITNSHGTSRLLDLAVTEPATVDTGGSDSGGSDSGG